jgi:hypothetical protein
MANYSVKKWDDKGNILVEFSAPKSSYNSRILSGADAQSFLTREGIDSNSLQQYTGNVSGQNVGLGDVDRILGEIKSEVTRETALKAENERIAQQNTLAAQNTSSFRPRAEGEDMYSYLVAKKAAGGQVELGLSPEELAKQNFNTTPSGSGGAASSDLVFQNGITVNKSTGQIIGVGDLRGSANSATGGSTTPYTGSLQDLANQGLQVSGSQVYKNGQVVGDTTGNNNQSDTSGFDFSNLISQNSGLTEFFSDTKNKEYFDNLPEDMKSPTLQMLTSLYTAVENGKIVNPNIEITPEKIAEFTAQATKELDPYYQEKINNYKTDIDTSLKRLMEDYNKGIERGQETFKTGLESQAQGEAEGGTAFSSGRQNRERKLVLNEQQGLEDYATQAQRSAQDLLSSGERQIGSSNLSYNPTLTNYNTSTSGYGASGTRTLFTPQGNLIGEIPKSETTAIAGRKSELEENYRRDRILDLSKLS